MTTQRALKQDIRARKAKTGESYSDAARWIEDAKAYPVLIAARPHANAGRRFHALRQPAAGAGNQIIFWGRSLCGLRATDSMGGGGWSSIVPHELPEGAATVPNPDGRRDYVAFDPDLKIDLGEACAACAHVLREQYQPDAKAKKQCPTCGQIKALNKFRQNRSGADGHARTCEQCRRDAVEAADKAAAEQRLADRLVAATAAAERWVQAAAAYQADAGSVPSFRCAAGHTLELVARPTSRYLGLAWVCACGEASLSAPQRAAVAAHNDLAHLRETAGQAVEMA